METMERMIREEPSQEASVEKIITHDGTFHTDEVFAMAILKDLFPEHMELSGGDKVDFVKYIRTRDEKVLALARQSDSSMLVDVGSVHDADHFKLDHHQKSGAGSRENGINYASAGLVWKQFGKDWVKYVDVYSRNLKLNEEEINYIWKTIDTNYVQLIDSNDTGQMDEVTYSLVNHDTLTGNQFTLPEMVRLYNIDVNDGRSKQKRFNEVVEIFRNLTLAMVNKCMDLVEGLRKFNIESCDFSADKKTVVIHEQLPPAVVQHVVTNNASFKDVEFYGYPTDRGGFSIMAAPVEEGSRNYRNASRIPQSLRVGADTKNLNTLLGIEGGVIFSHSGGFFASCKNIDAAKKFLALCTKNDAA